MSEEAAGGYHAFVAAAAVARERIREDRLGEIWRELESLEADVSVRVREKVRKQRERLGRVVLEERERLKAGIGRRKRSMQGKLRKHLTGDETKRVRDHLKEPPMVRLLDKVAFTLGVFNLIATEYFLLVRPDEFWKWYSVMVPLLLALRVPLYRRLRFQYFLYDFCYFIQLLLLLQIFMPWGALDEGSGAHCLMYKMNFAFGMGPLAWAIPMWRNSLVFHSWEKITSLYIHIFPPLLVYCWRWLAPQGPVALAGCNEAGFGLRDLGACMLFYFSWQLFYFTKTEVVDRARLDANPDLQTSLRWLTADTKNEMHKAILALMRSTGFFGSDERFDSTTAKTKVVFMAAQFVYTAVTLVPVFAMFQHQHFHSAVIIFLIAIAIYNGASFYISVFSRRYNTQFEVAEDDDAPVGAKKRD